MGLRRMLFGLTAALAVQSCMAYPERLPTRLAPGRAVEPLARDGARAEGGGDRGDGVGGVHGASVPDSETKRPGAAQAAWRRARACTGRTSRTWSAGMRPRRWIAS